jgi:hypothetical protein
MTGVSHHTWHILIVILNKFSNIFLSIFLMKERTTKVKNVPGSNYRIRKIKLFLPGYLGKC